MFKQAIFFLSLRFAASDDSSSLVPSLGPAGSGSLVPSSTSSLVPSLGPAGTRGSFVPSFVPASLAPSTGSSLIPSGSGSFVPSLVPGTEELYSGNTCNICPEGQIITKPDALLLPGQVGLISTCQEIDDIYSTGNIGPRDCFQGQQSAQLFCGCKDPETYEPNPPAGTCGQSLGCQIVLLGGAFMWDITDELRYNQVLLSPHLEYSIVCPVDGPMDKVEFQYGNETHTEYEEQYWMGGNREEDKFIGAVDYLSDPACGVKEITVIGSIWTKECFRNTYRVDPRC